MDNLIARLRKYVKTGQRSETHYIPLDDIDVDVENPIDPIKQGFTEVMSGPEVSVYYKVADEDYPNLADEEDEKTQKYLDDVEDAIW